MSELKGFAYGSNVVIDLNKVVSIRNEDYFLHILFDNGAVEKYSLDYDDRKGIMNHFLKLKTGATYE